MTLCPPWRTCSGPWRQAVASSCMCRVARICTRPWTRRWDNRCRYEIPMLKNELERTGFEVERMDFFNRISVFGWWWNGKIRKKRTFSRWQIKVFDTLVPILRRVDSWLPWKGLGIIAVARRPAMPPSEE